MIDNAIPTIDATIFTGAMMFIIAFTLLNISIAWINRNRMNQDRENYITQQAKSAQIVRDEFKRAEVNHAERVAQLRVDFEQRIADADKRHADERLNDLQSRRDERLEDAKLIGALRLQIEQLEKADLHKEKTIEHQAEVIQHMQTQLDEAERGLAENEDLKVQIANLQMRLDQLSKQVEKMTQDLITLKNERDNAIAEAERLKQENARLRVENNNLRAQIEKVVSNADKPDSVNYTD